MDFGLTDEQRLLQETGGRFVQKTCPVAVAKEWDERGTLPSELFEGIADQGWFGLPLPESEGGGGGGAVELCLITEQLGHASLDVAMHGGGTTRYDPATYVRTDTSGTKHAGLSLLLIDPSTPGVEVRRTPALARHILGTNDLFFTDVEVPRANLVGPLHGGWKVLLSGLSPVAPARFSATPSPGRWAYAPTKDVRAEGRCV
jgi:alkylation response protein AidB-like acyl-CoA dehydrogenase